MQGNVRVENRLNVKWSTKIFGNTLVEGYLHRIIEQIHLHINKCQSPCLTSVTVVEHHLETLKVENNNSSDEKRALET